MKIAIIGGGSFMWTPGFFRQFAKSEFLRGATVSLMDIDAGNLDLTHAACDKFNRSQHSPLKLEKTLDTDRALDGADFVVVCISTGGLDAMAHDLAIPEKYGIWHTVGDTVGPGGFARAVRNIPVFHDLAERMSRFCPNTWCINVTNPLTALTRVVTKSFGIKCVGMCPGVEETAASLAKLAGAKDGARLDYVVTGIDHGSFFTKLLADGIDVLGRFQEMGFRRNDGELPQEAVIGDALMGATTMRAGFAIWHEVGFLPSIGDRHTVENYPWFLTDPSGKLDFNIKRTNIAERHERRARDRARLDRYVAGAEAIDAAGHGDDPIGLIVEALAGHRSFLWGSNFQNIGQIPGVPDGAVVETRCLFDAAGVHPLASPMPDVIRPLVLPTILRQERVIDVTLRGSFDELVPIFWSDPLCSRLHPARCREMVKELLLAHRPFIRNPRLLDFS